MKNDILISGLEATWVLPQTDGDMGGTYKGTFKFRCYLNPLQQLQAGREYRELLGSQLSMAEEIEIKLAHILVQLKHRVIKAPPFWSTTEQESGIAGNVGDMNIIGMVFDAAMRSELAFMEGIVKERKELLDRAIKVAEVSIKEESEQ